MQNLICFILILIHYIESCVPWHCEERGGYAPQIPHCLLCVVVGCGKFPCHSIISTNFHTTSNFHLRLSPKYVFNFVIYFHPTSMFAIHLVAIVSFFNSHMLQMQIVYPSSYILASNQFLLCSNVQCWTIQITNYM